MYQLIRTDTADALLRKIISYISANFGPHTALQRLDQIETELTRLSENPFIGTDPKYMVLRRQGFKVLITEKELAFYKIDEVRRIVTIYAITDQRQDYLHILSGEA